MRLKRAWKLASERRGSNGGHVLRITSHPRVGGEFVGIRHRSIFGSREPGVPRDVVAMA